MRVLHCFILSNQWWHDCYHLNTIKHAGLLAQSRAPAGGEAWVPQQRQNTHAFQARPVPTVARCCKCCMSSRRASSNSACARATCSGRPSVTDNPVPVPVAARHATWTLVVKWATLPVTRSSVAALSPDMPHACPQWAEHAQHSCMNCHQLSDIVREDNSRPAARSCALSPRTWVVIIVRQSVSDWMLLPAPRPVPAARAQRGSQACAPRC